MTTIDPQPEPVVFPPSLIVPDNHEDIFRLDGSRRPARAVETEAQRKRIERTARRARLGRWIDNARPRYVPGAVTSGRGLFTAFRRTTPCTHEDEAVSMHEFLGVLRATLGHNLAVPGRPGYVAVIADDAAIVAHVRNEKRVLRAVADAAMAEADAAPARRARL